MSVMGLVAVNVFKESVRDKVLYNLVAFARRESMPFLMLADITREISEMYGLYDWQERKVLPGYVLLNPAGEVRLALLGVSFPPEDVARLVQYVTARL